MGHVAIGGRAVISTGQLRHANPQFQTVPGSCAFRQIPAPTAADAGPLGGKTPATARSPQGDQREQGPAPPGSHTCQRSEKLPAESGGTPSKRTPTKGMTTPRDSGHTGFHRGQGNRACNPPETGARPHPQNCGWPSSRALPLIENFRALVEHVGCTVRQRSARSGPTDAMNRAGRGGLPSR